MKPSRILLLLACTLLWTGALQAQTIKIATDRNMWYPYSYEQDGIAKGLHIDIVTRALENLGYAYKSTPLPWKRCLESVKTGKFDAIVSSSFRPERAQYLYYPPDASWFNHPSKYRITQVEYVIVTHVQTPYTFTGNIKTLPEPVRAPRGYSVLDDLRKAGVAVEETPGDMNSLKMLARDKKGCTVTLSEIAKKVMKRENLGGELIISKTPFISKSYFMVFSRKGNVAVETRQKIWEEIAAIRENQEFMESMLNRY